MLEVVKNLKTFLENMLFQLVICLMMDNQIYEKLDLEVREMGMNGTFFILFI